MIDPLPWFHPIAFVGLRIGCLVMVVNDEKSEAIIKPHFCNLARGYYLTAPSQGARIVERILSTPQYLDEW